VGADDKSLSWLPGDHYLLGPGERDAAADLIADWLAARGAR
jgi:hypothetical protein